VVDGIIRFKTFASFPDKSSVSGGPQIPTKYDFDGDGFGDYSFAHRLGKFSNTGTNVSYKQLTSGVVAAPREGITAIQLEPLARQISGAQFVVKGRVIASSPAYIPVSSPVKMHVLQKLQNRLTKAFHPMRASIGQATIDPEGNFTLRVSLQVPYMSSLASPSFRIITSSGFASLEFPLPEIVKSYKSCTYMNFDFKGGVAKSASSKNKGVKTKLTPEVNAKVYELNKKLDTDKDGLVCES
jgi:hypothetical protein